MFIPNSLRKNCVKQHKKLLFSLIYIQKQKHAQSLDTSAFGHVFQFSSRTLFLRNNVPGEIRTLDYSLQQFLIINRQPPNAHLHIRDMCFYQTDVL